MTAEPTPDRAAQDEMAQVAIEKCRSLNRKAGAEYIRRGVQPIDVALAAAFSAHDLAMSAGHSPIGAIEWLRTAADLMERQLLAQANSN